MKKMFLVMALLVVGNAAAMNRAQGNMRLQDILLVAFILGQQNDANPTTQHSQQLPQLTYAPRQETPPYQQHQRKPSNPYTRHRNNTCNGIRVSPHHFGPTKNKE